MTQTLRRKTTHGGVPSLYCYTHYRCCCACPGLNCCDIFGLLGLQERCNAGGTIARCRSDRVSITEGCICGTSSSSWPKLFSFISCVPTNRSACVPTNRSACIPTSSSPSSLHSDRTCPTIYDTSTAESCLCPADLDKWSNLPLPKSCSHFAALKSHPEDDGFSLADRWGSS